MCPVDEVSSSRETASTKCKACSSIVDEMNQTMEVIRETETKLNKAIAEYNEVCEGSDDGDEPRDVAPPEACKKEELNLSMVYTGVGGGSVDFRQRTAVAIGTGGQNLFSSLDSEEFSSLDDMVQTIRDKVKPDSSGECPKCVKRLYIVQHGYDREKVEEQRKRKAAGEDVQVDADTSGTYQFGDLNLNPQYFSRNGKPRTGRVYMNFYQKIARLRKFLCKDSEVIFLQCNIGYGEKGDQVGQFVSNLLQTKVMAPSIASSFGSCPTSADVSSGDWKEFSPNADSVVKTAAQKREESRKRHEEIDKKILEARRQRVLALQAQYKRLTDFLKKLSADLSKCESQCTLSEDAKRLGDLFLDNEKGGGISTGGGTELQQQQQEHRTQQQQQQQQTGGEDNITPLPEDDQVGSQLGGAGGGSNITPLPENEQVGGQLQPSGQSGKDVNTKCRPCAAIPDQINKLQRQKGEINYQIEQWSQSLRASGTRRAWLTAIVRDILNNLISDHGDEITIHDPNYIKFNADKTGLEFYGQESETISRKEAAKKADEFKADIKELTRDIKDESDKLDQLMAERDKIDQQISALKEKLNNCEKQCVSVEVIDVKHITGNNPYDRRDPIADDPEQQEEGTPTGGSSGGSSYPGGGTTTGGTGGSTSGSTGGSTSGSSGSGSTPPPAPMLEIINNIPVDRLRLAPPDACPSDHYHGDAYDCNGVYKTDPDPTRCGHGPASSVTTIPQSSCPDYP